MAQVILEQRTPNRLVQAANLKTNGWLRTVQPASYLRHALLFNEHDEGTHKIDLKGASHCQIIKRILLLAKHNKFAYWRREI